MAAAPANAPAPAPAPCRFSVVMATRNRPIELEAAVRSVLAQQGVSLELIVVDDGSDTPVDLSTLAASTPHRVQVVHLARRTAGHGPSFARNEGVAQARGDYLAFLDDDDLWIDDAHLSRCDAELRRRADRVDACFTHQEALRPDGSVHPGPLWLGELARSGDAPPDIDAATLARVDGFAHLNCSVYRRAHFVAVGGFDEAIRYEEDRDLYLRAIDAARAILWLPRVVARHHIPDRQQARNASTALADLDRHLYRMRWCDRLLATARDVAVRAHAARAKEYGLKHRVQQCLAAGDRRGAQQAARDALACRFTLKWAVYVLSLLMRR